jgi:DnaJ-class molecular chaperone
MSFNNPYDVLGVSEKDSLEHIETVYKGFMKLLHPDKSNTPEAKRLGMSHDEKMRYLNIIVESYKTIKESYKERIYPDTNRTYRIDQAHTINFNNGLTEEDASNFNEHKFNMLFDNSLKRDSEAGMTDPFRKGYEDFNLGRDFSKNTKVTAQSYSQDISVENSKNTKGPKMKDNRLIEYVPDSTVFSNSSNNYQELGITSVSDFSTTIQGKGTIHGTDLMTAYGQNLEPWQTTVQRDAELYSKFNDQSDIVAKSNNLKSDRANIYNLPLDQNMIDKENRHLEKLKKQENKRVLSMKTRDEYYNSLNQGRLEGGQLPSRN